MSDIAEAFKVELLRRCGTDYADLGMGEDDVLNWVDGFDDADEAVDAYMSKYDLIDVTNQGFGI